MVERTQSNRHLPPFVDPELPLGGVLDVVDGEHGQGHAGEAGRHPRRFPTLPVLYACQTLPSRCPSELRQGHQRAAQRTEGQPAPCLR